MSTFKSNSGRRSSESIYGSYSFIHDLKPCSGDSSSLDFLHDSRQWLNHHGLGRSYPRDKRNVSDTEVKRSEAGDADRNVKSIVENQLVEEHYTTYPKPCCSHGKNNEDSWFQEFESIIDDDMLSNVHLMDLDACNSLLSEQSKKLSSDLSSQLTGLKNAEPWWHSADKDDLASITSQTSPHDISKCDCLGVQTLPADYSPDNLVNGTGLFNKEIIDKETKIEVADHGQGNLTKVNPDSALGKQGLVVCTLQELDGSFGTGDSLNAALHNQEPPSGDLNRNELLEALCHSQTRARKAEELAQAACDEKDQVINLFFQQASCLFAYRQWLRILQLETLCLRLRSKELVAPFTKGMTIRKNRSRAAKKKLGKRKCQIHKCAIAFAVGLSLAGAGLLVGWTIGWLFPAL